MMHAWWKVGLVAVFAITVTACGGGGGGGSSVNKPRIRYVNASPDVDPVTFTLDGDVKASGIAYLGLSPVFIQEDQDTYDVAVHEDGSNPDLDAVAIGIQNDKEYLVNCLGLESFGVEQNKRLRIATIEINLTAPNGNRSRIYVLHAFNRAAGFDTPNIDLRNPGDNPQYKVEDIAFGAAKSLEIDASAQTFVARRNASESVYATETATFDGGGIYLAIVGGVENAVGIQVPQIEFIKLN
ncbi:MAG: DUF4397 domain-containing protein [Chlorobia bacterium]|nr:DUF4397 domain-containing protein [Fimbriimonadaceae bacterium]